MKTFTRNLVVALFFAGAYAADVVRRQNDSSPTTSAPDSFMTGNGQGNSGSVSIISGQGNGVGNTDVTTTISNGDVTTTTSHAGAMGMWAQPTMMPMVAGGFLAAAAANAAIFL